MAQKPDDNKNPLFPTQNPAPPLFPSAPHPATTPNAPTSTPNPTPLFGPPSPSLSSATQGLFGQASFAGSAFSQTTQPQPPSSLLFSSPSPFAALATKNPTPPLPTPGNPDSQKSPFATDAKPSLFAGGMVAKGEGGLGLGLSGSGLGGLFGSKPTPGGESSDRSEKKDLFHSGGIFGKDAGQVGSLFGSKSQLQGSPPTTAPSFGVKLEDKFNDKPLDNKGGAQVVGTDLYTGSPVLKEGGLFGNTLKQTATQSPSAHPPLFAASPALFKQTTERDVNKPTLPQPPTAASPALFTPVKVPLSGKVVRAGEKMSNIPEENEEIYSVSSEVQTPCFGVPSSPVRLASFASSGVNLPDQKQSEAQPQERPALFSSTVQPRPEPKTENPLSKSAAGGFFAGFEGDKSKKPEGEAPDKSMMPSFMFSQFKLPEKKAGEQNQSESKQSEGQSQSERQSEAPSQTEEGSLNEKKPEASLGSTNPNTSKNNTIKETESNKNSLPGTSEPVERTYFQRLKPRSMVPAVKPSDRQLIDFALLQSLEKQAGFVNYLNSHKEEIIKTVKMYFSVRSAPLPEYGAGRVASRQQFYCDLGELLLRTVESDPSSLPLIQQFVKTVMMEERYEQVLFHNEELNLHYFREHCIYAVDKSGRTVLNPHSRELFLLNDKLATRWTADKLGLLNLLLKYPDLVRLPADTFTYLFSHLLRLAASSPALSRLQALQLETAKLSEFIHHYCREWGSTYRLLQPQEVEKLVPLIEEARGSDALTAAQSVLLNLLCFSKRERVGAEVVRALRETRGLALLPMRTLLCKQGLMEQECAPLPEELFRHVRGDMWAQWLDMYLAFYKSDVLEMQSNEPQFIVESLCSFSPPQLLQLLLEEGSGVAAFFQLIKEEGFEEMVFRVLCSCVGDEDSVHGVLNYYFKKDYFHYEYQEIVLYFTSPDRKNLPTPSSLFDAKLNLLALLLAADPSRLFQLQRSILTQQRKRTESKESHRTGQKLLHVLIDFLSVLEGRAELGWTAAANVMKMLQKLLQDRRTQEVALEVMAINRPNFGFLQNGNPELLQATNQLLDHFLTASYLHDILLNSQAIRHQTERAQMLFPVRYSDAEYLRLDGVKMADSQPALSVYWLSYLLQTTRLQPFNASIFSKLLGKLMIEPYQAAEGEYRSRRHDGRIPPIFEHILLALNSHNLWEECSSLLQPGYLRTQGKLLLVNRWANSHPEPDQQKKLFNTLKLLTYAFRLAEMLQRYRETTPEHFLIKAWSSLHLLTKLEPARLALCAKHGLLLSLLGTLQPRLPLRNSSASNVIWETEAGEDRSNQYPRVFEYIREHSSDIDFEIVTNLAKTADDKHYNTQETAATLAMELISTLLRLCPDTSIEQTLSTASELSEPERDKLKEDSLDNVRKVLLGYLHSPQEGLSWRGQRFLFDLKYNAGSNKLNAGFADRIFLEYLRGAQNVGRCPRLDALLAHHLLNELETGSQKCDHLIDATLRSILQGFRLRRPSKDGLSAPSEQSEATAKDYGRLLSGYQRREHGLGSLDQMERLIEERAILKIGEQMDCLEKVTRAVLLLLVRKKHSHHLLAAAAHIARLAATHQLFQLSLDLPALPRAHPHPRELPRRLAHPRCFVRDPMELALTERPCTRTQLQVCQKGNLVQWFLRVGDELSRGLTHFLKFVLTIDNTLYGNNPIAPPAVEHDLSRLQLFAYLPFTAHALPAVELFGSTPREAAGVVQMLGELSVSRLEQLREGAQGEGQELEREAMEVVGFCLEWLNSKSELTEGAAKLLGKCVGRHYSLLLPQEAATLSSEAVRVLLSVLSFHPSAMDADARLAVEGSLLQLLLQHWSNLRSLRYQAKDELTGIVQEALPLLLVVRPIRHTARLLEVLVELWTTENNSQYFANSSRVLMEMCANEPEATAQLKPLSRCTVLSQSPPSSNRYADGERKPEGMAWIWMVKIASTLANQRQLTAQVGELSCFWQNYSAPLLAVLQIPDSLTKAYLQELEAVLELIVGVLSLPLWVSSNSSAVQDITHTLTHLTLPRLAQLVRLPIKCPLSSQADRALAQVSTPRLTFEDDMMASSRKFGLHDNVFQLEIQLRVLQCVRNVSLATSKAMKVSSFVEKQFSSSTKQGRRYGNNFWDRTRTALIDLGEFSLQQTAFWANSEKLTQRLHLLQSCQNAPLNFVENGMLPSVLRLPSCSEEMMGEMRLLGYLLAELQVVLLMKERLFSNRNCRLLTHSLEEAAAKLREYLERAKVAASRQALARETVSEAAFDALLPLLGRAH